MHIMTHRDKLYAQHKLDEHNGSPFVDYFKEIIYGGVDGIVTTFAIVAGFSGAALSNEATTQLSFAVVLLFGLANLFADSVSMGLGNFLSVKSEQDLYKAARAKETHEVRQNTDLEHEETITIMLQKGFSEEDAQTLTEIYKKNETYWVDFMMNHELEMSDPRGDNPTFTGFATALSFVVFGAVPLLPFVFLTSGTAEFVFILSSISTLCALIALGILKWKIIGTAFWRSLFEVVLIGGVAATVAFGVGSLFTV
ncbi:MAG: VIT1/CCC1 family predicted Fe2+/Mn2+ transporter [Candidatus Azotimanducaceae bacterium]|jgi:VIT1/CCC1 family predicted Fe2+/Mn2+ transporter